jgi:hypothetical protein
MGSYLYHQYEATGSVTNGDVRNALYTLTDDDVSVSSPITGGASEVSVHFENINGTRLVVLTIDGHDGDWTKTSESALTGAVQSVEGVGDLVASEGGYES